MLIYNLKHKNCDRCGARVAWVQKQNKPGVFLANVITDNVGRPVVDSRSFHSVTCDPTGGNRAEIELAEREMNESAAPVVTQSAVQILERVLQQPAATKLTPSVVKKSKPSPISTHRATYKCENRNCAVDSYDDNVSTGKTCFQCGDKLKLIKLH